MGISLQFHIWCTDTHTSNVIPYLEVQEFVLPSFKQFRYYYHTSVSLAQSSCSYFAFCHLFGNSGTTAIHRFHLLSRCVCNLRSATCYVIPVLLPFIGFTCSVVVFVICVVSHVPVLLPFIGFALSAGKFVICVLPSLGNSRTTTISRFCLLSRRVRNLQLHNMLVAALSKEVCATLTKYYSYICNVTLWHMKV